MEKDPIKVKCSLRVRGDDKTNAIAQSDLDVPDPDEERATAVIKEALKDSHDEERSSQKSVPDNS